MTKPHLKLVAPSIEKRTVTSTRLPNAALRTREHLTEAEVERLMDAARKNRWGHRDATMVLTAYPHGFRPAELVDLRWDQIEFASGALHVRRVKRGTPSTHPILGDELRACGYALANKGHDTRALQAYLGHRNIQHTVRYTELSPTRFKDFWRS